MRSRLLNLRIAIYVEHFDIDLYILLKHTAHHKQISELFNLNFTNVSSFSQEEKISCIMSVQTFLAARKFSFVPILVFHVISLCFVIYLLPADKRDQTIKKIIEVWIHEATSAPQDCLECTDRYIFREAATQEKHIYCEEFTKSAMMML